MNKIPNRKAICDVLLKEAETDKDIVVLCSDSRGSASLAPFADAYPEQFVEMGIAEQDLVSVSAGLAHCGKKAFAASPACFLSTRSYEQCKIDVAYSNTNVKLIGISGGISYGALGMSHHSAQDIAAMSAIPNMRVYLSSDRFQTAKLIEALLKDEKPAYIRVGRNPVEDIYTEDNCLFEMDKATVLTDGTDAAIIACGEMVRLAYEAAKLLEKDGIHATVLDMYCVKPLDKEAIVKAASNAKVVVTAEEHAPFGGLGSMVSQVVGAECPRKVLNIALPDAPVVSGDSQGALFGQGCIEKGMVKATYGTGSSVMMNAGTEPIMSDLGLVTSLAWGLNGKITYVLEGNINYTGAVITWLKDDMGLITSPGETQEMSEQANKNDTTYLVPAFSGLGAPYWKSDAKAIIYGMSRTTGKKEVVKAALESIAYQITDIVEMMKAEDGMTVKELCVDGALQETSI